MIKRPPQLRGFLINEKGIQLSVKDCPFSVGNVQVTQRCHPHFVARASHQIPTSDAHVSALLCGLYPVVHGYAEYNAESVNGRHVSQHSRSEYWAPDCSGYIAKKGDYEFPGNLLRCESRIFPDNYAGHHPGR